MAENEFPNWIRGIDIIVGILSVTTAFLIIIESIYYRIFLILVLVFSVMAIGIARVARAGAAKSKGLPRRAVNLVGGLTVIIIAGILFVVPGLSEAYMIQLISIAWIVLGLTRLIIGILETEVDKKLRILQVIIGLFTISVAFVIEIIPNVDLLLALTFLGSIVGVNGLARMARSYSKV
ncbi:MAG: hypothetical protein P1Q69_10455 [Candidatus Thorarchaeota archaeon]|nr:hypothetical protein [Candidatus Thorarchaeota archaeon]